MNTVATMPALITLRIARRYQNPRHVGKAVLATASAGGAGCHCGTAVDVSYSLDVYYSLDVSYSNDRAVYVYYSTAARAVYTYRAIHREQSAICILFRYIILYYYVYI